MVLIKKIGVWVINILFWVFFILSSMVFFLGALLIRAITSPFDPNLKFLQQYSCLWASLYLWVNPYWKLKKYDLGNAKKNKAYVIVCNHQSMADILVLFNTFLHFKWVSKKAVFKLPLLGWNMWLNGYIPIERGSAESRAQLVERCHTWLKKGSSVLFFPEGTRSKDGTLLPFKVGAFRLALDADCDILPLVITGSLHAIPKHSLLFHRKSHMQVRALPEVSIEPFKNLPREEGAEALMNLVRSKMEN